MTGGSDASSFEAVKEAAEELLRLSSLPVDKYQSGRTSLKFSQTQKQVAQDVVTQWMSSLDPPP